MCGRHYVISRLICNLCGEIMYVPRYKSMMRKRGHKKHMYCPFCKAETVHTESYD